jgi:hypothetical protein
MDDITQSLFTHPPRQLIEIHAYIVNNNFFKVNDNIKFLSQMDDLHPKTMEAAAVKSSGFFLFHTFKVHSQRKFFN